MNFSLYKAWQHFNTITKHRHKVITHCAKAGILFQGLLHDLSKYTPTEFMEGARFYQGTRSPNEAERESRGFSNAWIHHKGRNRHHFEHWTDYDPVTKTIAPVKMPVKCVIEMFCDRVAASKIYKGSSYTDDMPLQYFMGAKHRRVIQQDTAALLEYLLVMLRDKGEKETFRYIKSIRKLKDYSAKDFEINER
ncbi:MAG: DUF5662 family protein [Eubacteriales bacterium]|nr:DUF5662 family protein [Eubacteriales bacterium]